MNSKIFWLSLLGIPAFLSSGCDMSEEKSKQPNIIVVLADDQGWGDMAYNGHPVLETPNFDNLASTGLRFDRFYAAAPVCSPTRGSIMTGRHPNRFGCFSWGHTLRPQEITVAEKLREAGYITGHFGKWHLGPVYKGSPVNPGSSGFDEWFSSPNFFENDPVLSREGIAVQTEGESSMVTMDAALDFIKKHKNGSEPFFAYVCFGSPHQPHIAVEEDKEVYAGQSENLQNFYGEITGMDRAIGKLRQELKNMGIDHNTVLWYLSDNGGLPKVGTTGGREYKGSIYEGGLRVPSIIEWPAVVKKHRITKIPCSTVDVLPTILEIAGVSSEGLPVLDGVSLLQLLNNQMSERTKPIGFWKHPTGGLPVAAKQIMADLLSKQQSDQPELETSLLHLDAGNITVEYPEDTLPGHAAILDWPYKLHRIYNRNGEVKFELYDLEADSAEANNIAEANPDILKTMTGQLEEWMISVVGSLKGNDYPESLENDFLQCFEPPAEYKEDFGDYPSPLKFYDGREVTSADDWALRRKEILTRWNEMMGNWPDLITDQEFEYLGEEEMEEYVQHKVRFHWLPDETTEGYLLIPKGGGMRPAVITVYYEPETAIGKGSSPYRDYASQLAKRGFVTLSIGTTEATENRTYSLYYPDIDNATVQPLSMLAYAAANAWQVLSKVDVVDSTRIGIVGHSFGGKWSMFASCLYDKFTCAVWSDPGIVFEQSRPSINYWEPWYLGYHPKPWRTRGLITEENPAKGLYPELIKNGYDLTDLHALMAPRPFFVSGGSEDPPHRWKALNHAIAVNDILEYSGRVAMSNRTAHSPDENANNLVYKFFEHFLMTGKSSSGH